MIPENRFACLTYHAIGDNQDQYVVSEYQFKTHLAFLTGEGFVVEGFEQLEARLRSPKELPPRYVVLTLDDGHESSMRAAELLAGFGCGATFFLTRDHCESKVGFIRAPQIRELRQKAFSLGTHGASHRKLTFLPEGECIEELRSSKKWLEDVVGEPVSSMAAPGGYINPRVMALAAREGYLLTGTCNEWMNSLDSLRLPGAVNRVSIRRHFSPERFRQIVQGHLGFYLLRQVRSAALAVPKQLLR